MKIGIITILNVNNYGAELQAFSLNHKLRKLGYESEIINYHFYKNADYIFETKAKPIFKISEINKLKEFILKKIDLFSVVFNKTISEERKNKFDKFHQEYSNLSEPILSISELYNKKMDYDVYIVGSDQVWNPNNHINIEPYFLNFAPKEKKKISYASSFGVGSIETKKHSKYNELLNNIDILSCREDSGVELIKNITDREATHVLDPTLLLTSTEWEDILIPYEYEEPYILLFVFKNSDYLTKLAYDLQKKTGYKIIRICKNAMRVESDEKIINIRDAGPREFLGIYKKASIVITTSFHGTIFSLIFQKPFYTVTPANKNNNTRQQGLLKMVGLEDRLIKEGQDFPDIKDIAIDFENVQEKIENKREKSITFIKESIL